MKDRIMQIISAYGFTLQREEKLGESMFYLFDSPDKCPVIVTLKADKFFVFSRNNGLERAVNFDLGNQ